MLKEISIKKKTIKIVKEFEIKVFMDYMAMKRCIDHTQSLNTCKHSGQKNNFTLKVSIEYNKFSTCQGGWSRRY